MEELCIYKLVLTKSLNKSGQIASHVLRKEYVTLYKVLLLLDLLLYSNPTKQPSESYVLKFFSSSKSRQSVKDDKLSGSEAK